MLERVYMRVDGGRVIIWYYNSASLVVCLSEDFQGHFRQQTSKILNAIVIVSDLITLS